MSCTKETSTLQQTSESSLGSSIEWFMANDVFVCGGDVGESHGGTGGLVDPEPAQAALNRHLPLLMADPQRFQQDMMLGIDAEDYCSPSYADIDSEGSVTGKKRLRSNSSRHRGEIVTELGPEEIRWFYKEDKRTWKPFIGHDSLKIETAYRRCCELNKVNHTNISTDPEDSCVRAEPLLSHSEPAVCVRGGLYEVDIREKECYPVYWNQQDRIPVMRGQWFTDGTWLPLEEDESDFIELEHLMRFRGQQMRDTYEVDAVTTTVDSKDAIHSLKLSRSHVDWHSVDEVYLYSDATTSKIARTFTQKLGFSKASSSGTRLHRGYVEEAAPEDTPPETTHIVFVVHGIGQKMDQGRIIRNTIMMRDAARKMEEKHFADRVTEHVEFLPVEWRSKLCLDGDTVDSITPDKVRGLRDMLNSSAMDIMYYTSPLYRDEVNSATFMLDVRDPVFCLPTIPCRTLLAASSLTTLMTGWDPVRFYHQEAPESVEIQSSWCSHEEHQLQEQLRVTRLRLRDLEDQFQGLQTSSCVAVPALKFKVENFFCMGSPLAVFLALRGIRPGCNGVQDHILPTSICKRLFNIFPSHRSCGELEPLILKHTVTFSPTPYDQIRPTLLNPAKETASVSDSESLPSPCTSPPQARRHYGESITNLGKASIMGEHSGNLLLARAGRKRKVLCESKDMEEEFKHAMSQSSSAVMDSSSLELERRIDYELREGLVESRYWSTVTSHTAYWCSYDVALFLLTFMYRPQEAPNPAEEHPQPS
uniref:DDHD domain-containing protein n=1 Tax=Gouania willdenowi TaxID=441366 RepID=A0A8C5EMH2_GOUWI